MEGSQWQRRALRPHQAQAGASAPAAGKGQGQCPQRRTGQPELEEAQAGGLPPVDGRLATQQHMALLTGGSPAQTMVRAIAPMGFWVWECAAIQVHIECNARPIVKRNCHSGPVGTHMAQEGPNGPFIKDYLGEVLGHTGKKNAGKERLLIQGLVTRCMISFPAYHWRGRKMEEALNNGLIPMWGKSSQGGVWKLDIHLEEPAQMGIAYIRPWE